MVSAKQPTVPLNSRISSPSTSTPPSYILTTSNRYQELPSTHKSDFAEITHQVYVNDNERTDLIRFYNLIFTTRMKPYLFSSLTSQSLPEIASATPFIKKPVFNALVLESPLRESLPQTRTPSNVLTSYNQMKSPRLPVMATSPAGTTIWGLKPVQTLPTMELKGLGSVASKRYIDFDDGQENNEEADLPAKKRKGSLIIDKILSHKDEEGDKDFTNNSKYISPDIYAYPTLRFM